MRSWTVFLVLLACPLACAHAKTVEKLETNQYRITCSEASLDRCLHEEANKACDNGPYFVERGISDVNNRGLSEAPNSVQSSQAIVRCGPKTGWGDEGRALMAPAASAAPAKLPAPAAAPAAAPAPKPVVCAPGSSQPCTGTAGCRGGQACREDGSGYQPCDCGNASASPAPAAAPVAPTAPPAP